MNKTGLYSFFILLFCMCLISCANPTSPQKILENKKKNIEYNAILTDPIVKKDFRNLKSFAQHGVILQNNNNPQFDEPTIKKLNEASAVLIDRLQNHYHLDATKYKIHAFIGRNKAESCYQYYDSSDTNSIGKNCNDPVSQFGSCKLCENYVNTVRSRTMRVIHAPSRNNTDTMALIDTFKLHNGDFVYLGLELTPE